MLTIEKDYTYGISEFSVDVKIPKVAPNFFTNLLNLTTHESVLYIQNLSYNANYTVRIIAANCFGIESTTELEIMQGIMVHT